MPAGRKKMSYFSCEPISYTIHLTPRMKRRGQATLLYSRQEKSSHERPSALFKLWCAEASFQSLKRSVESVMPLGECHF